MCSMKRFLLFLLIFSNISVSQIRCYELLDLIKFNLTPRNIVGSTVLLGSLFIICKNYFNTNQTGYDSELDNDTNSGSDSEDEPTDDESDSWYELDEGIINEEYIQRIERAFEKSKQSASPKSILQSKKGKTNRVRFEDMEEERKAKEERERLNELIKAEDPENLLTTKSKVNTKKRSDKRKFKSGYVLDDKGNYKYKKFIRL